jgi:hypothetical protein
MLPAGGVHCSVIGRGGGEMTYVLLADVLLLLLLLVVVVLVSTLIVTERDRLP